MKYIYCHKCGNKLITVVSETGMFHIKTGKPVKRTNRRCPNFREFLLWDNGHDDLWKTGDAGITWVDIPY